MIPCSSDTQAPPIAPVTVRWSPRARALFALPVPICAAGVWWSLTTAHQPSRGAAVPFAALSLGAALFQVHIAFYRLVADGEGLVERWLWRSSRLSWDEIRKVELIAQRSNGQATVRSSSGSSEAFHVILHSRAGRVGVHRWMSGVDALLSLLAVLHVLERDDPAVPSLLPAQPALEALDHVGKGLALSHLLALSLPFSLVFGLTMSLLLPFRATANLAVDAGLLGLVPWGGAYVAYRLLVRERGLRFGPAHARLPLSITDGVLITIGALAGPALLWFSLPQLLDFDEGYALLAVMGATLTWYPVSELRRVLREK